MKAIIIAAPGDIRIIEANKPKAGPGDVVAKVVYSGICGTDLAILKGDISFVKNGLIKYPVRIGHEWSGIVTEVGENVTDFKLGDRVVGDNGVSCGECDNCMKGRFDLCENGRSVGTVNCWDGSFAEYIIMPARHMYKLPETVDLDEAAMIEPVSIALSGVKKSGITPESKVLVIGTGPIGLAAVSLVKNEGASTVLLSGRKPFKLEIGRAMGADAVVNATSENIKDFVMAHTGGKGVDVVIETSGDINIINQSLELVAPNGVITLIGFYEASLNNFDVDRLVVNAVQLKGIAGSYGIIPEVIGLLSSKKLSLKSLITHRFKFNEAIEAMQTAVQKSDTKIKMLVEFDEI